jgi:hypothetical protein
MLEGRGGGFLPFPAALHEPDDPEDILVAAVETLRTLALLLLARHLFLPLNAVKADDEVVVVEILAMDGAYERRLDC